MDFTQICEQTVLINSEFREDLKETHLCQPWSLWGVVSPHPAWLLGSPALSDVKTQGVWAPVCLENAHPTSDY